MKKLYNYLIRFSFVYLISVEVCLAGISISTKDIKCHGDDDGEATITVSGASGTFEYTIARACYIFFDCDKKTQSSGTFTGLKPGNYKATVKDVDTECEYSQTFTINEPAELSLGVSGGGTFQFCDNQNPPTVTLTAGASGGTPNYTYSWPGGTLTVSSSGTYTCTVTDKNGCTKDASVQVVMVPIVCSRDPNEIAGPEGVGPEKWVAKNNNLPYTIKFENDPEFATAPAQVVRINQPLDKNVNIYSLKLGSFGFGNFVFEVPENRSFYSKRLDLKDSLGVMLDITAGIDVTKNEVFWVFRSIDPVTGLAPSDANLGFLLVNDSITHKGEGFVSYTIKSKSSTVTRDSIYAEANIVFDINEPIITNKVFNTIDAVAPNSFVNPVPEQIDSTYAFSITASDENGVGSGIGTYDLYFSQNNGPFNALAINIPADSVYKFAGKEGINYCLFSIAKDLVGNIEPMKTNGDVCFGVPNNAFVKVTKPSGGESYCLGSIVSIKWESSGVDSVDLFYTINGTRFLIAEDIEASDTIYSWTIPGNLQATNTYKILIMASSDTTLQSEMNGYLTLNKAIQPEITATNGNFICAGDSATLRVSPGYVSYKWSTTATTPAISVFESGWYSIEVTDRNGCSAKDSIEITVYPAPEIPVITASGPTSFCQGGMVTLSAPAGFAAYEWSNGDTTQSISTSSSGSFNLRVINENGCQSAYSDTTQVVVYPNLPQPVVTASGPLSFCQGGSVVLSAPSGFASYLWTNGATTPSITISSSGGFSVKVTSASGCESIYSDTVGVEVLQGLPAPIVIASGPLSFCQGESVVLSAPSGFASYLWTNGATTPSITISSSGGFSVKVTNAGGCESIYSDTVEVEVLPGLPAPVVTASGPLSFCQGGSVVLSAPSGFASYLWTNGATTPSITVNSSGGFRVKVTNASGCESIYSDTVEVEVLPGLPAPVLAASGPLSFCQGESVVLSAPSGFASYLWTNGATTPSITVNSSGGFSVKVTNASGCESVYSDTVEVEVLPGLPAPVVTASGPLSFCQGRSVVLSAPSGFASYLWTNGATTPSITVNSSGGFSVKVANAGGCESIYSDTVEVEVLPGLPALVVTASGPLSFCQGESVVLSAPSGFASYLWTNGATTPSITVNSSGGFSVKVTNASGCESIYSDTIEVEVLPGLPAPVVTASGPLSFCQGGSVVLSAPSGFASYLWTNGATTSSITVNSTGGFSVKVKNASGCESIYSDTVEVEVLPGLPAPIVTASGPLSFCQGGSVILSAPAGFASYLWSDGATTPGITVNSTGSFSVKVKNASGCESLSSALVNVSVLPPFPAPVVTASGPLSFCQGGVVTLSAPAGFASYLWSNGATTTSITVNSTGSFSVKVKNANGCESASSASVNVNVLPPLAAPIITASGPLSFCQGGSVVLSGPSGFASYFWSNGATTQSITVNSTGSFSVKVKDAVGCESPSSAPTKVNVSPPLATPLIIASGPLSFCPGGLVILSSPAGFASYLWSNGATTQNITVNSTGSFSVKVKNTIGCESPSSALVNVNVLPPLAAPVITASGPLDFCQGQSVVLSAPAGFASYLWSNNAITPSITVSSTGMFSVKVKNSSGCQSPSSAAVQVKVHSIPAKPVISLTGSPDFCNGGSVKLKAPDGFAGYLWSNGATGSSIAADASGSYTVKVYNNPGCTSPSSDPVIVSEFDPFTFELGGALTVYNGYTPQACTTLKVQTITGGTAPFRYKWNTNQTTASINVCPTVKTTYSLTITDANNCSFTDYINVCVIDVRCENGNNKVSVCHKTGSENTVTLCLAPSAVKQHLDHGDYLGSYGTNESCSNPDINARASDESGELKEGILYFIVSPNPFSNNLYITLRPLKDINVNIDIINISGEKVGSIFEGEIQGQVMNEFEFKAEKLNDGVYFCRVHTKNGTFYRKLILIK